MTEPTDRAIRWALFAIVAIGIGIRLVVYLHNRSLWMDEALLAVNLVERPYSGLLSRLDCMQVAPPLFLLTSKFIYGLWGQLEYSLRLLPLVCSCLSLWLMGRILLRTSSRFFALCALLILAIVPSHIEWATSFKQYASDELSAVLVLMAAIAWERLSSWTRYIVAASLPALVWLSHTSVFVLLGLVIVAGASALKEDLRSKRVALTVLLCSMIIACCSIYFMALQNSICQDDMVTFWVAGFPQSPYTEWLTNNLVKVIASAAGVPAAPLLVFVLCVWGACELGKSKYSSLNLLAGGTLASALVAAWLHLYPFTAGRITIYYAPVGLVFLASGLDAAHRSLKPRVLSRALKVLGAAFVIFTLYSLVDDCPKLIARQEMRQVLEEVRNGPHSKAIFVVSVYASPAFLLYAGPELQRNTVWLQNLRLDSGQIVWAWRLARRPARFWVVVSHGDFEFVEAVFSDIESFCMAKQSIRKSGSAACLLELRPEFVRAMQRGKK